MLKLFKRRRPKHRAGLLTGRELAARALFSRHVNHSPAQLEEYDSSPLLQQLWQSEADLHLSVSREDRDVAAHFGYTIAEWISFSAMYKVDRREEFFHVKGLAA